MKYIHLLLISSIILITSCIQTTEDKINNLVEQHIKTCLYVPDSYESVTTKVDSAFTPYNDPGFHEKLMTLNKYSDNISEHDANIKSEEWEISSAKSSMAIWSDGYSATARHEYKEAKEQLSEHQKKYEELLAEKEKLIKKGKQLYDEIIKETKSPKRFIGYQVNHRYRAENNDGQKLLGDVLYVFNKDLSKMLLVYDLDSNDFHIIEELIKQIKEESGNN